MNGAEISALVTAAVAIAGGLAAYLRAAAVERQLHIHQLTHQVQQVSAQESPQLGGKA